MLQFSELSKVFPEFNGTLSQCCSSGKQEEIVISEEPEENLPVYELPESILEEIEILGSLKKGKRIRRINGKIHKETRFSFMRKFTGDSRKKACEDIQRILSFTLTAAQKLKVQNGRDCLDSTYKGHIWFKDEEAPPCYTAPAASGIYEIKSCMTSV
jgi:hypothetical protein